MHLRGSTKLESTSMSKTHTYAIDENITMAVRWDHVADVVHVMPMVGDEPLFTATLYGDQARGFAAAITDSAAGKERLPGRRQRVSKP
jgi:hypothetical protein